MRTYLPRWREVTSDAPLWDWAIVAKWLFHHKKLSRDEAIEAEAVKAANEAIKTHEPHLRDALKERLEGIRS